MKHDEACELGTDCQCATRAYLADATPEELADYDAWNSPAVRPRLDIGATHWRGQR